MTDHNNADGAAVERRQLLKRGLILGSAGAAVGVLGVGAGCARAQVGGSALTLDVACNGDTLRIIPAPGNEEGELRGSAFFVEGWVYPEDTIDGDGFDPEGAEPTGIWLCRGWFMNYPERPEPHVITTQEYILGSITSDALFPPDTLSSSGMEGSDTEQQAPVRSVIGGTGTYGGATGVVVQEGNGRNTTELRGVGENAPNFRFRFSLSVPDLG